MAHHRFLLAGIQRSNAGILLADTETSEGRKIAEIQDSLANPDKPYAEALEALRGVMREAAPSRIESSNAAPPSNAAPSLSALAPAGVDGEGGGGGGGGGDGSDGGDGGDDGDGSGGGDGGGAAGSSSPTRKRPADALDNEDSSR